MEIRINRTDPTQWRADTLILPVLTGKDTNGGRDLASRCPGLDQARQAAPWLDDNRGLLDFEGELGSTTVLYGPESAPLPRAILAGLGKAGELNAEALQACAAAAFKRCRELWLETLALPASAVVARSELDSDLEEMLLGGLLGLYQYRGKKHKGKGKPEPKLVEVYTTDQPAALEGAAERAEAVAAGIGLARDLVNAPANISTPEHLAETARQLVGRHDFELEVMDLEQIQELGMGAFAAVAQGSAQPPRLIVLKTPRPHAEGQKPLVFVGKGVTFDTGGISIKPSAKMEEMKADMAGAAAILGLFKALGEMPSLVTRPVVGIIPCAENMPDGKAVKPGDVVETLAGKSVEVVNTDAEGRLLLCDGLAYAERFDPAGVVDIATLTGACVVALGDQVAAVFSPSDSLARSFYSMGLELGERLWPMPMWKLYAKVLESEVADLKNVGPREGGAIHAAMFLKNFAPAGVPWAHLDIAGPAWAGSARGPVSSGGTGFGVRLLVETVRRWRELTV
jgi:leucyl aminopeptidase